MAGMASMASTRQRDFRGALLRICKERMGRETWNSFCFLYEIHEGLKEKGRSAVLEHLVNSGEISCDKPGDFAERLRKDLGHAELAQVFLEAFSEGEVRIVETRQKVDRGPHDVSSRRHGRHFTPSMIGDLAVEGPPLEEDEDPPTDRDAGGVVMVRRPRTTYGVSSAVPPLDDETLRRRHDSDVSQCSLCSCRSSGYNSWRSSSLTSRSSVLSVQSQYAEDAAQHEPESQLQTVPELLSSPHHISTSSSSSSFEEVEFQSCLSSSMESLSTNGSLPRSVTAGSREEFAMLDTRGKREISPECVDSTTHSTVRKTDSIVLKTAQILTDIDQRQTGMVYRSLRGNQHDGIDFELRFSPTSHEGSTASSLHVDVYSHCKKGVIPPLDITVSMYDPALDRGKGVRRKDCMAFEQRSSKGSFIFQGQYTALFPQLVDHETLHKVTGDDVVIQVAMEYSVSLTPSAPE